jgi:hypothetical protein
MEFFSCKDARSWIDEVARLIAENAGTLTELDTAIGDGDHGANMTRGLSAVEKKLETTEVSDVSSLFKLVGMTLLSTVGGPRARFTAGSFWPWRASLPGNRRSTSESYCNLSGRDSPTSSVEEKHKPAIKPWSTVSLQR